ncbi:MAG: Zn-ribbon domain-containing OB-fold protein [Desulfobacteraceae bacterium]|nr:Zn-ribbon domain-containing OB-fold protein [Desulfobacteraceae bacterium]
MTNEKQTAGKREVPMVPYLRLPESPKEDACLIGSRCKNCGETYLGMRVICINCYSSDQMEEVTLSRTGELFTYTVVYQSAPWVQVPYAAVVVRLPEGPVVRASLTDFEPSPDALKVGMPVEMVTEKVSEDNDGNDVIAYKFKLADAK